MTVIRLLKIAIFLHACCTGVLFAMANFGPGALNVVVGLVLCVCSGLLETIEGEKK